VSVSSKHSPFLDVKNTYIELQLRFKLQCLILGVFPDCLKLSIVTPIFKKTNSFHISNIRPISLLSIFSKVFEKVMVLRLTKYLNSFLFFSNKQFVFQKGKSTEDALLNITSKVYDSFNMSFKTTGLFIDFRQAFDLENHSILLNKLETVGVGGVALRWFSSFLTGRRQQVRIGDCLSEPRPVGVGVPQGSVLSGDIVPSFY